MTDSPQLLLPGETSVDLAGLLPFGDDKTVLRESLMFVPVRGNTVASPSVSLYPKLRSGGSGVWDALG
jgi:hypothetical protein